MSTTAINWTELDSKLMELHEKGLSFKQIGEAIGVSTSATHKRYHHLKKMQAKEPVTEPTAKLETVEEETQPATESITDFVTDDEPIPYVVDGLSFEREQTPESVMADLIINKARNKVDNLLADPVARAIVKELALKGAI